MATRVTEDKQQRDAPWPIRINEWRDEIATAAKKHGVTAHAYLKSVVRQALDKERT